MVRQRRNCVVSSIITVFWAWSLRSAAVGVAYKRGKSLPHSQVVDIVLSCFLKLLVCHLQVAGETGILGTVVTDR